MSQEHNGPHEDKLLELGDSCEPIATEITYPVFEIFDYIEKYPS
jgi:hypothetical protein